MLVFVTCEFSQRYTDAYEAIGNEVNKIDWHLVINDKQLHRMLLIIMVYAQKELEIKFFGSISCSREQFKRVSR